MNKANYANRLIATQVNSGPVTSYTYDHSGARITQATGNTTTIYPTRYYSLVQTTSGTTTYATSTEYVFAGDKTIATIDQPMVNGTSTGTSMLRFVHVDHLGSTNVVSSATGTIAQWFDYAPYGSVLGSSGSGMKRQYIGQYTDDSGLSYLNARYYDSGRGQFVSEDPTFLSIGDIIKLREITGLNQDQVLADPHQMNAYSYGRDNPVRFSDPKGLYVESGFDIAMLALSVNAFRQEPSLLNAAGVVLDMGALASPGLPAVGGLAIRAGKAADATYTVYQGYDAAGDVRYVGITSRELAERVAEHRSAVGSGRETLRYEGVPGTGNLTRTQARLLYEQPIINQYGLQKNGGQLFNKINSISPTSPLNKSVPNTVGGGSAAVGGAFSASLSVLSSALQTLSGIISSLFKR